MRHVSTARAAMSLGLVFALWHAIWVLLVASGRAADVLNFILRLHFIELRYELAPYSGTTAFLLVAITFCIGALIGAVFAVVWNWLTFESTPKWARDAKHPAPAE